MRDGADRRPGRAGSSTSPPAWSRWRWATASRTLLRSLGVQQVVAGGQSMNPSTAQILEAVDACAADGVIVLPNNKNIVPVARAGARAHRAPGRRSCRPRAVVEALAALVVYDARRVARRRTSRRWTRRRRGCAPARSRRRCATAARSAGRSSPATGSRSRATASASPRSRRPTPRSRCSTSWSTTTSELVTVVIGAEADAADTARITEHLGRAHPDVEVELHDRWPAALPVPRRRRVAPRAVTPGLTLRELAAAPRHRAQGGRDKLEAGLAEMGITIGARPARALPAPLRRPHRARRDRRARDRRRGDGRRRGPRRSASRRTRDGKRTIVNADGVRRHRSARDRVLQPGLARAPALGRHAGVAVREGRAATAASASSRTPSSTCSRARLRRGAATCRRHRHDRARVPAIGEGRGAHLAAPARGRVGLQRTQATGLRRPARRRQPRPSTVSSTARARTTTSTVPRRCSDACDRRAPARSSTSSCACSSRSWRASARCAAEATGIRHEVDGPLVPAFHAGLPFPLTGDQTHAIAEITADLRGAVAHAPAAAGRGRFGQDRRRAHRAAHRGAGRLPGRVHGARPRCSPSSTSSRCARMLDGLVVPAEATLLGERPVRVALLTNRTPRGRAAAHHRRAARTATSTSWSARTR